MKREKTSGPLVRLLPDETTRQWFQYALQRRSLSAAINLLLLLIGLPAVGLVPTLCFLFAFNTLRKYAGGYHAATPLQCLLLSALQTVVCVYVIYPLLRRDYFLSTLLLACTAVAVIFRFAPILPLQLHATVTEWQACRIKARCIVLVEFLVVSLLMLLNLPDAAFMGSMGMAAAATSLIIVIHPQKKEEDKNGNA